MHLACVIAFGVNPKQVAAADLGESEVKEIFQHRGTAKKRLEMEFEVLWPDGDSS